MATQPSSTITKSFQLLALFQERGTLTVNQGAILLGAPRASVHRLLISLEAVGALERTDAGHFQLGLRLLQMGSLAPVRREYDAEARRPLQRLCATTGFPVHLAARDGHHAVLLEALPGTRLQMPTRVGITIPLHSTASGKILLAHAPDEVVDAVLDGPLPRFTRYTIQRGERLRAELAQIRSSGLAYGNEETHYGLVCVAAPIHATPGSVRTAVSLTYPSDARTSAGGYRDELIRTRNEIEAQLCRARRRGARAVPSVSATHFRRATAPPAPAVLHTKTPGAGSRQGMTHSHPLIAAHTQRPGRRDAPNA